VELARGGSVVDVTAFPVAADEDAWPAAEAVRRFLDSGAPPAQLTLSSDAGGCLPCFDADGRVETMDVGRAGALLDTLRSLLAMGVPLADALAPLTANPARLLRLPGKGRVAAGADADFLVLGADHGVDTVVIGGTVHVKGGVALKRGTFEN
jgi:beta-aspartyl-dipeptidase (metallo-type)